MIDPVTIGLAIGLLSVVYVAYNLLKVAIRTIILSVGTGLAYLGLTWLEVIQYEFNMLLALMMTSASIYVLYKMIKIPLWVLRRVKSLFTRSKG